MSFITVFSGSFCRGDEIAAQVTQKLGCEQIESALVEEASRVFDLAPEKLARAMTGPPSWFNTITRERERAVAYIRATLSEYLRKDNILYSGYAGHLLPNTLRHVLRVCIVADHGYRIQQAVQHEGLSEHQATESIEQDDLQRCQWTQYLFDCGPWDKRLYDIKVPIHTMTVDEAVAVICENAERIERHPAYDKDRATEDFSTAAQVSLRLVEKGYDFEVSCQDGVATIPIKRFTWRLKHLRKQLQETARSVPGINEVEIPDESESNMSSFQKYNFDVHPKILLVDDEQEYVLTLSERLQVRDMPSHVVYNGEQALSLVQDEEPDVIVLDLMMPGIPGIDVLRRLKKDHPNVEVIILTGHGSTKDEALARELGAFAYLQKPTEIDKLAETMKAAYAKKKSERAGEAERDT